MFVTCALRNLYTLEIIKSGKRCDLDRQSLTISLTFILEIKS